MEFLDWIKYLCAFNLLLLLITTQVFGSNTLKNGTEQKSEDFRKIFIPNIAQCAIGNDSFCTEVDDYPLDFIQDLLREKKPAKPVIFDSTETGIENRMGIYGDLDKIGLCQEFEQRRSLKAAIDIMGIPRYIVNTDEYPLQLSIKRCSNVGGECCSDFCSMHNKYRSKCEEGTITAILPSVSEDGQLTKRTFSLPSGCGCSVSRHILDERDFLSMDQTDSMSSSGLRLHSSSTLEFILFCSLHMFVISHLSELGN